MLTGAFCLVEGYSLQRPTLAVLVYIIMSVSAERERERENSKTLFYKI